MSELLIPPVIELGFEPDEVTDPELQAVIADDLAWAIWLLWRPCHIVSQHFNQNCLASADRIRERNPSNMREWRDCFSGVDFPWRNVDDWISQAYAYLTRQAPIRICVRPR